MVKYLKEFDLFPVPYDENNGFCVMKSQVYDKKLQKFMNCQHFAEIENGTHSVILKVKRKFNNKLIEMKKKQELTSDKNYSKLRSTGGQCARLHDLTKENKDGKQLRPVQSIPATIYH